MSVNLYIVRHGKINREETNKTEYLHLNEEGLAFGAFLDKNFSNIYFDHIFYQSIDNKSIDSYNICRNTIRGMKGVKTEFDKTQLSKIFLELNESGSGIQNIMICFRAEGFNVVSNIINSTIEDDFNKEYHRVFHYRFINNNYSFIEKFSA